jgi:hypothetical protein
LDFVLDIGSTQEVVTVTGTAPMLNVDDATSGVTMGSEPAQVLPLNGRGLQGLLELAPGVLATPANGGEAGQFSTEWAAGEYELLHRGWREREQRRQRQRLARSVLRAVLCRP